jgi:hypothetical protein
MPETQKLLRSVSIPDDSVLCTAPIPTISRDQLRYGIIYGRYYGLPYVPTSTHARYSFSIRYSHTVSGFAPADTAVS